MLCHKIIFFVYFVILVIFTIIIMLLDKMLYQFTNLVTIFNEIMNNLFRKNEFE